MSLLNDRARLLKINYDEIVELQDCRITVRSVKACEIDPDHNHVAGIQQYVIILGEQKSQGAVINPYREEHISTPTDDRAIPSA